MRTRSVSPGCGIGPPGGIGPQELACSRSAPLAARAGKPCGIYLGKEVCIPPPQRRNPLGMSILNDSAEVLLSKAAACRRIALNMGGGPRAEPLLELARGFEKQAGVLDAAAELDDSAPAATPEPLSPSTSSYRAWRSSGRSGATEPRQQPWHADRKALSANIG